MWKAWRADPVTSTYGPAELAMVGELAYLFEEMVRSDRPMGAASEVRQWLDRLGLNPKGKRDLRLRIADVDPEPEVKVAPVRRLKLVAAD